MCWSCFLTYDTEPVINERVQAAYDFIEHSDTSSNERSDSQLLHIIYADFNVDDLLWDRHPDAVLTELYDKATPVEQALYDILAPLSEEERATVMAMEWGYLDRDGTMRPDVADLMRRSPPPKH